MHNLEPYEAYLIHKMINYQNYAPTWDTLKKTFSGRPITQINDLVMKLGRNINAIDNVITNIGITIKDISNIYHSIFIEKINDITPIIEISIKGMFSIYQSIFRYMSIKDCENLFDAAQQFDFLLQNKIEHLDNSHTLESEQNLIESHHLTLKTPENSGRYN